jgi:hypothetical protein
MRREFYFSSSQLASKNDLISDAEAIVRRLAYHPLAVVQAGASISSLYLPLEAFLDHYHQWMQASLVTGLAERYQMPSIVRRQLTKEEKEGEEGSPARYKYRWEQRNTKLSE